MADVLPYAGTEGSAEAEPRRLLGVRGIQRKVCWVEQRLGLGLFLGLDHLYSPVDKMLANASSCRGCGTPLLCVCRGQECPCRRTGSPGGRHSLSCSLLTSRRSFGFLSCAAKTRGGKRSLVHAGFPLRGKTSPCWSEGGNKMKMLL